MAQDGISRDLGPCVIDWNSQTVYAFGDVVFRVTYDRRHVHRDDKGTTPVSSKIVGAQCEVEVPVTDATWTVLAALIPSGAIEGVATDALVGSNPVGVSQGGGTPIPLTIKPIVDGAADSDEDNHVYLYDAAPAPSPEFSYNNESQRVFRVMFQAYPNSSGKLWRFGPTPVT